MPSIWYQMGLHCRELSSACPFQVAGYTFSGVPGVVIGHNDRIAWGFTNMGPDVICTSSGSRTRDTPCPAAPRRSTSVRRPFALPVVTTSPSRSVRPGMARCCPTPARSCAALAPRRPSTVSRRAIATRVTAFRCAGPRSNLDVPQTPSSTSTRRRLARLPRGSSAVRGSGAKPRVRRRRGPHRLPVPGTDSHPAHRTGTADGALAGGGLEQRGRVARYIPFEELPSTYDPPEGYIVTANNAVAARPTPTTSPTNGRTAIAVSASSSASRSSTTASTSTR